jgi:hypothetical protein
VIKEAAVAALREIHHEAAMVTLESVAREAATVKDPFLVPDGERERGGRRAQRCWSRR